MIRTQIQLPESDYERLREAARRQGRSMADCIREGIDLYLAGAGQRKTDLASLAGRFHPRNPSDLKPHDQAWIVAAGEGDEIDGDRPTG
jgi:hypothetical protein